jgi:hypothetical protein
MEPVESYENTVRALVPREHREVRGPTSEGSGADFHDAGPKEVPYASEVLAFFWIHHECIGLTLYRLGVHFGDEYPQVVKTDQLLVREVHGTESDAKDRCLDVGTPEKEFSEKGSEALWATLVQKVGARTLVKGHALKNVSDIGRENG